MRSSISEPTSNKLLGSLKLTYLLRGEPSKFCFKVVEFKVVEAFNQSLFLFLVESLQAGHS